MAKTEAKAKPAKAAVKKVAVPEVKVDTNKMLKLVEKAGAAGMSISALRDELDTGMRGPARRAAEALEAEKKVKIVDHNKRAYVVAAGVKFEAPTKVKADKPAKASTKAAPKATGKAAKGTKNGVDKAATKPGKVTTTKPAKAAKSAPKAPKAPKATGGSTGAAAAAADDLL